MNCSNCGRDLGDVQVQRGTSKKNGKPWAAKKCPDCETMNWVRAQQGATQGAPAQSTPAASSSGQKKDYGDRVPPSMYGAWACNLAIAVASKREVADREAMAQDVAFFFKSLGTILNGATPAAKPASAPTPAPKPAPAPEQAAPPDDFDIDGLDDIDI